MSQSTTALQPAISLRRRTNPLEAAHRESMSKPPSRLPSPPEDIDDGSSSDTVTPPVRSYSNAGGNGDMSGQFSAGSGIAGSNPDAHPSITSRFHTPSTPQSQYSTRTRTRSESSSDSDSDHGITDAAHTIASATSWSDLPLLVTLVPPVVALFTGGDYLRDVLLTCLMVWYLYQVIKIPWDIYLASLPLPHVAHQHNSPSYKELRTTRIAALLLCAVTPFLGATLLRLVASLLYPSSADPLSWFSTALFVLAAGIRPWRHLAHLVLTRTEALHLAVHRPSTFRAALLAPKIEQEVRHRERERDTQRVEALESEIAQLRSELSILTERTRGMAKHLKLVEKELGKRTATVEGRVEVLERYGSGAASVSGWELIWRGLGKLVCVVFPFMEGWFEDAKEEAGKERKIRGKKAKRLRNVVNNLPPVPEVDEANVNGGKLSNGTGHKPAHRPEHHAKQTSDSGLLPPLPKADGIVMRLINVVTWPLRLMRGFLSMFVGAVRG